MLCKFFLHNWAHIRVILEADGLKSCDAIRQEVAAHFINGIHGTKNTHQAIYVTGPRGETGTQLRILHESDNKKLSLDRVRGPVCQGVLF